MTDRLTDYINGQTRATICCIVDEGTPYCFICFYAFNPEVGILCFKSSAVTRHAAFMKKNPFIAGSFCPIS